MFQLARENSSSDLLCIINADMLLMPDFVKATMEARSKLLENQRHAAALQNFVLLSQRWDMDITQTLDFSEGWQDRLSSMVHERGALHRPAGSDFFLFPRTAYTDVPAFTIGRAGWDNWMIYKARKERWPVIDCTPSVMIVHQNHDYSHLPGGKPHYEHPDTNENIRLAGGQANIRYTILDSTHLLVDGKLPRPKMTPPRFERRLELFLRKVLLFLPEKAIENIARPQRWRKRLKRIIR